MIVHDIAPFFERFGWPRPPSDLPMCIAHRGASGHVTENTLAAFQLASQQGAQVWELDTQLSRDGVVFVSHDDHLQRVFGADLRISEMTAAELAESGLGIPRFEAVAREAQVLGAGLYVELKAPGSGPKVWEYLKSRNQWFACLGSFDVDQVRQLRRASCDYPLAVLVGVADDPFDLSGRTGADVVHLCWERAGDRPQDLVSDELLVRAFDAGLEVVLWHEERESILADLMARPVLGICTDLPDMMQRSSSQAESIAASVP